MKHDIELKCNPLNIYESKLVYMYIRFGIMNDFNSTYFVSPRICYPFIMILHKTLRNFNLKTYTYGK